MEAQAPAKQTADKKTAGGRKSEPSEARRSGRNTQRQKKVAELTPGAAEEETRTLRSGAVSQAGESTAEDPAGNETPEPNSQLNPLPAQLTAATRGNQGSSAVAAGNVMPDTDNEAEDSEGEQKSQDSSDLSATYEPTAQRRMGAPTDVNPQLPSHKDIAPILQQLSEAYKQKGKKEAEIVAQEKLIRAAYKRNKGRLELDLITLKRELFETEVSIEKLLSKAGPWRETFENRERFEKLQKSLREEVPYHSRKLSTTSYSASSDTEGDFKKPQAPAKKAPTKSKKKDGIHWQELAFDVQEVTEQEKKKQQREEFNMIQEDFPPLSPAAQPTKSPQAQAQVSQEDPVAPMEVSSNHSAASGMSGVVHGDAVGMNDGAADAVLVGASDHGESVVVGTQVVLVAGNDGNKNPKPSVSDGGRDGRALAERQRQQGQNGRAQQPGEQASTSGADAGTSGNFWERRRFFPAGAGPSFGGQAFRRQKCVKLVWEGKKEEAPSRTYIIKTLLERSAKFKAHEMEACIVQSPTEWDVSFKIPQGLDAFWRLFDTLKNQPEWKNVDAIPVSRPETKTVTIIVKNEGVPVNDVALWLQRQCTVLSPLARIYEDDVWTGGWKTEVKLKIVDNIPQHLPTTFFIGKEKCRSCLVERCTYCGKIGHTKKVCKIIMCNLCGNIGHAHCLCPKAWHNNNTQREDVLEQEEDQLLIDAVQEIEQQERVEINHRQEAAKANQAQQRDPGKDQSSKGKKAQSQEGSSNDQGHDVQRPQAGPSLAKKGPSKAVIPPKAPDPKEQPATSRAITPQQSQESSLSPAPTLQEHSPKKKKKKKKGNKSPEIMSFSPQTSNRYAQLQSEGDDLDDDDDDSWGSKMETEFQRIDKELSLQQSVQHSSPISQSTPMGGGTISDDMVCSEALSEVVGPTMASLEEVQHVLASPDMVISQSEMDPTTEDEMVPLGDEDPIPAGVQIKRFGEGVCEDEREGKKAKLKNQHGYGTS
ncbi:hypothetical protein XELAEV_18043485mg [Xenopus laevis]|uniref:CCHC-type domain-containing protein n=1 Tax=Xenopus laevis TaxID=8355 RepID=A0A974H2E5_XENLA|nr:hypothetical protein XELAEV_18043485mg [Xenopus laevis]